MKKIIGLTIFFLLLAITGCKKNDNPSSPAADPQNSPNITASNFPQSPSGGDPRSSYAPNSPVFQLFTNSIPNATVKTQFQSNVGSGVITLSGSSAASGTYSANNLSVNVQGQIDITQNGKTYVIPLTIPNTFSKTSGTWSVISQGTIVFDNADTVQYAVNDKGMFLIFPLLTSGVSDTTINYGNAVLAFKK